LSPLTLEQSFLGDSRQDVIRCNFDSSVGPEDRHYKSRKGIFTEINGLFVASPAFVKKMEETLNMIKRMVGKIPYIKGSYKDEIRSLEKLEVFKIRIFYTVDLYTNQLSRMYLQPLVQLLLRFPYWSKCFGKLNSGSKEWDDLYRYLKQGSKLLDLDFATFDVSHFNRVIRAVAQFFYLMAMKYYDHEESARVCYVLVYSLCCQLFEHKSDFALKYKGMPSGHIITLIMNSIINIILMMVAFEELCPGEDFFENVFPATVGDDNASGLSSKVCDKFNLVTLQPIYAKFGYTVTDARKSGKISPFVSPEDLQFVKRKFLYNEDVKMYVAPLEKDSIYKMLAFWCKKSIEICSYVDRMSQCLDVALREMFLHGRTEYDKFVKLFKPEVDELGWIVEWYSYDELVGRYLSGESFMNW
jgi:hypothetical protein